MSDTIRPDRLAQMQRVSAIAREARAHYLAMHPVCRSSTIESLSAGENQHAGVIAHVCTSTAQHMGFCVCHCGHRWRKM